MSRNFSRSSKSNRTGRWAATLLALSLVGVCLPALAFDENGIPAVSDTTAATLKVFNDASAGLALPFTSATIYDTSPPTLGTASSPSFARPTGIPVSYSGMRDAVSGLKSVSLWVRTDGGAWGKTGQSLSAESGTFTFNPHGVEGTYYFAFRLEDNAGNLTPIPSGTGMTNTKADGTPPVITLNGAAQMTLAKDAAFTDPGATAMDAIEGNLTNRIQVTGAVDTTRAGVYTLRYNVSDSAGNAAKEATRTVTVEGGQTSYQLAIPDDLEGQAGATIPCPVMIADTEGLTSYNLAITFDRNLLEVARVTEGSETGRLGWRKPTVNIARGRVTLQASGNALRGGSGSLAIIYLTVKDAAEDAQTSPLSFATASLNGGAAAVSTQDGLFTVNNQSFLWGDVNGDGEVDNTDAVLVLQNRAGLVRQNIKADAAASDMLFYLAGNVSGDDPPRVGTVDASLIMRYNAGAISRFPADIDGDGVGPELSPDKAGVKEAVLDEYGDKTQMSRLISVPGEVTVEPGVTLQVPVSLDAAQDVRGYCFELLYDHRALEFVNISSGSLTQDWIEPIVNPLTGKITVVGANAEPMRGAGTLAVLTFRATPAVTPGAITRLTLETAELNDGLLTSQKSTGMGEPVITAIEPNAGADSGGAVVRIAGANLRDVSRVLFGGAESPWVYADPAEGVVYAVTPPGGGVAGVTVQSPSGTSTFPRSFTYFVPQVQLTMTPEGAVATGNPFDVPVWIVDLTGGQVSTVTFDLCFDPRVFTPIRTGGSFVTAEESALVANKTVSAVLAAPGRLRVTVEGSAVQGIESGLLATCHLLPIAAEEQAQALVYITNTSVQNAEAQTLPASAGSFPE